MKIGERDERYRVARDLKMRVLPEKLRGKWKNDEAMSVLMLFIR